MPDACCFSVSGATPKISYLTDTSQHIVFTSLTPSMALTYDTMVGVHSVWSVRRAKQEVRRIMISVDGIQVCVLTLLTVE